MHSLIYNGAEAQLYKTTYLGLPAVEKIRIPKKYKIKEIDDKIRKTRTKTEVYNLLRCGQHIAVPKVFDVNLKKMSITMQFIDGKKLKDYLPKISKQQIGNIFTQIGKDVMKLHQNNIVHGDLTTSNLIYNGKIYFIDFGLAQFSRKVEDKAVDLSVFKKMLKSTHYKDFDLIWNCFKKAYKDKQILKQLEKVEKRGRYIAK